MIVGDRLVHYWRTSIHVFHALDDIFILCVDKFRIPLYMTHHLLVPPTIHHAILLIYHCKEIVLFYFPSKSFNKRIVSLRFIACPGAQWR